MTDFYDFFSNLLYTGDWPPRWNCGKWTDFHGWLTILSDLMIWLAYFFIPVILIKFTQSKKNLPFLPVFWLFGAFIILCGFTHLMDAVIFWWPAYRFGTLVKLLTSLVSLGTVVALIKYLPLMINFIPKDEEKKEIIDSNKVLQSTITELNKQVLSKENEIDRMKLEIARLKNLQ
ncbi:MAG: hypothetical protein KJ941_05935 [Bacteroidetes bacterium]|nr:hypothetical protein [Bacteroidota bacterium]